nr:hypothetical protein GCM10020092_032620 [Actinoplanes digitatis]
MIDSTAPRGHTRRAVLGSLAAAAVAGPVLLTRGSAHAGTTAATPTKLVWSPDPRREGLSAFEGVEDDRSQSHPGTRHIYVQGDAYRFDMHTRDRDGDDRQRNEVKGMRADGRILSLGNGETWRITYDLFIPNTLRGTRTFTHIFQLKRPGNGSAPLATIGLRRDDDAEYLTWRPFASGGELGNVPLEQIWNRWATIDMTFTVGDEGSARFICREGGRTLADATRDGIDLWLGDRLRPKWGIYRSLGDPGQLHNTYLLQRNLRAYTT